MISKNELKIIKSLKIKKFRVQERKFLIEGLKNVQELLKSDFEIEYLLCTKEYQDFFKHVPHEVISKEQLNSISTLSTNSSCVAVAKIMPFDHRDIDYTDHIIVLDSVGDPGNLGSIIRSLDWFGFNQIVCSTDCADFHNPKTISATMGSFTRIKPYYLDLDEFLSRSHAPTYGMDLDGANLSNMVFSEPGLFVMGSESHGISQRVSGRIQHRITIPKVGHAESLNVAMATSILAFSLRFTK